MRTAKEIAREIVAHEFSVNDLELAILRHAEECVKLERERCAKIVDGWVNDSRMAAERIALKGVAEEIRGT